MSNFVDSVKIEVQAGNGGSGHSSFRREKFVPKGGPDGGDGGDGGDVILKASHNLQTLLDLKNKRQYRAGHGARGSTRNKSGKRGHSEVIVVPCGTLILDEQGKLIKDLTHHDETFVVANGGKGGLGNQHFATSRNRAPKTAQPGMPGESKTIQLELRLIAQIGLIGLPNAGKSTLLKALTASKPKIGAYPFTTLYPNLGVLRWYDREVVLADIPGLIEGASKGVGLGSAFLRHVDRTQLLVHLVEATEEKEDFFRNLEIIQNELLSSDYDFSEKIQLIAITKIELFDEKTIQALHKGLVKYTQAPVFAISSHTRAGLESLIEKIYNLLNNDNQEVSQS